MKKEKVHISDELIRKAQSEALSAMNSKDEDELWDEETQKNWDERTSMP